MQIKAIHNGKIDFLIQDNWVFETREVDNEGESVLNIQGTPSAAIKSINITFDNEENLRKAINTIAEAGQLNVNKEIDNLHANFYIECNNSKSESKCNCNDNSLKATLENLYSRLVTLENQIIGLESLVRHNAQPMDDKTKKFQVEEEVEEAPKKKKGK